MRYVDLHVHSNHSDGASTVEELVQLAIQSNLSVIALTDHDTVSGIPEIIEFAKGKPITIIPGVEMSSRYESDDVHILGYYVDYKEPAFLERLEYYQKKREERNMRMIEKMQSCGIDITPEKFYGMFPDSVITRAHFGTYLMRMGYVSSVKEAFSKYVGPGKPCYMPKESITPAQAVECIKLGKGVPVLAHPMLYKRLTEEQLDTLIVELKQLGLVGIETLYSENSPEEEERTKMLAQKHGLFMTGGSDFHGATKPHIQLGIGKGNLQIPEEFARQIRIEKNRNL